MLTYIYIKIFFKINGHEFSFLLERITNEREIPWQLYGRARVDIFISFQL